MTNDTSTLPTTLPIYPLSGSLLFPGNTLPCYVYEKHYRQMIEDAVAGERAIGVIQPRLAEDDYDEPRSAAKRNARPLYTVGCMGWITEEKRLARGRYQMVLQGISRFRAGRELEVVRGYRRMEVDYGEFTADLEPTELEPLPDRFFSRLPVVGGPWGLKFDLDKLRAVPATTLVDKLSMILPFGSAEKQALLEAHPVARRAALMALIEMGLDGPLSPIRRDSSAN